MGTWKNIEIAECRFFECTMTWTWILWEWLRFATTLSWLETVHQTYIIFDGDAMVMNAMVEREGKQYQSKSKMGCQISATGNLVTNWLFLGGMKERKLQKWKETQTKLFIWNVFICQFLRSAKMISQNKKRNPRDGSIHQGEIDHTFHVDFRCHSRGKNHLDMVELGTLVTLNGAKHGPFITEHHCKCERCSRFRSQRTLIPTSWKFPTKYISTHSGVIFPTKHSVSIWFAETNPFETSNYWLNIIELQGFEVKKNKKQKNSKKHLIIFNKQRGGGFQGVSLLTEKPAQSRSWLSATWNPHWSTWLV